MLAALILILASASGCKVSVDQSLPAEKIRQALSQPGLPLPADLYETGLFKPSYPLKPVFGVLAYEVQVSLWTDGTNKDRFIFVPPESKVQFDEFLQEFSFPVGTTLAKHFSTLEGQGIETRVLTKKNDGSWLMGTYLWKDQKAELQADPKVHRAPDQKDYRIPSPKECAMCHNSSLLKDPVLGFRPEQLINPSQAGKDSLNQLVRQDLFESPEELIRKVTALPDISNQAVPLAERTRTYLDINCAACHQPGGYAKEKSFDLRRQTPLSETKLTENQIVIPKDPDKSKLWQRFKAEKDRMPPLSLRADPMGETLIKPWIEQW